MGSLLRDWISPKVLADGTAAINHDHQMSKRIHQGQKNAYEWRSDGSLVIHSYNSLAVQLIEFTPQKYAWVSDSHTRLVACFTKDATAAFKKAHGSSFGSQGGAILTLADYYLTINPSAVPSRRVTFTIQKAKLLGSGGSSTFGKPEKVEEISGVQDLILRIQQLSAVASGLANPARESLSPALSQANRMLQGVNSRHQSPEVQAAFATQAFQASPPQREFSKQLNSRAEHPAQTRHDRSSELLAVLAHSRKDTVSPTRNDLTPVLKPAVDSTTINNPIMPLQPVTKICIAKDTSRLQSKANIQISPFLGSQDDNMGKIQVDPNYVTQSVEIDSDNNQEKVNDAPIASEPKINHRPSSQIDGVGSSHGAHLSNLWEGCTRISRQFVQIPKDQRSLLERDDSWVSSGTKSSLGVPPTVVLDLQTFHDRSASSIFKNKTEQHKADAIEEDNGRNDEPLSNQVPNGSPQNYIQNLSRTVAGDTTSKDCITGPDENSDDGSEDELSWTQSHIEHSKSILSLQQGPQDLGHDEITPSFNFRSASERDSSPGSCSSTNSKETEDAKLEASLVLPPLSQRDFTRHPMAMLFSPGVEERVEEPPQPYSSSPVEMEVAVPYGIDDQMTSPAVNRAEVDRKFEITPSTNERQRPNLQVTRTPHQNAHSPQSRSFRDARDAVLDTDSNTLMTRTVNYFSDPVIPGTIDVDGIAIQVPSTGMVTFPANNNSMDVQRSTIFQNPASSPAAYATHSSTIHSSPLSGIEQNAADGKDVSGSSQPYAKIGNLNSQDEEAVRDSNVSHYASCAQVIDSPGADGSRSSDSNSTPSHALVLATQMLDVSRRTTIPSEIDDPLANRFEVEFSQVDRPFVNTAQMIRANRHAFIDDLALQVHASFNTSSDSGALTKPTRHSRSPIQELRHNPEQLHENAVFDQVMRDSSPMTPLEATLQSSTPVNTAIDAIDLLLHNANSDEAVISLHGQPSQELVPLQHSCFTFQNKRCELPRGMPGRSHSPTAIQRNSFSLESAESDSKELISTAFDRYRASYPAFTATQKRFIAACVYLEFLKQEKKAAPHPMLWDDFIRAFCNDYRAYVQKCRNSGSIPMVGIDFYNEEVIPDPIYTKRIVSQFNLKDILLLDPTETERIRDKFRRTPQPRSPEKYDALGSPTSFFESLNSMNTPAELSEPRSWPSSTPKITKPIEKEEDVQSIPEILSDEGSTNGKAHGPDTSFVVTASQRAGRRSFFETPRQMAIKNKPNPVDTTAFLPIQDADAVHEAKFTTKQSSESWGKRRLSLSLSSGGAPEVGPLFTEKEKQQRKFSNNDATYSEIDSTSQFLANSGRGSPSPDSSTSQNRYSSILENRSTQGHVAALDTTSIPGGSPILGTRVFPIIFPDQEQFRTPDLPARRSTSKKLGEFDNIPCRHQFTSLSIPAKRKASSISSSKPAKRLSWAAFSTTYESRKKRLSTASNSTPVPCSVTSSTREGLSSLVGIEHNQEPETQDWNISDV